MFGLRGNEGGGFTFVVVVVGGARVGRWSGFAGDASVRWRRRRGKARRVVEVCILCWFFVGWWCLDVWFVGAVVVVWTRNW